MKKFDLEEFKNNPDREVVTEEGQPVRILCINARGEYPVVALVLDSDCEIPMRCKADGTDVDGVAGDLFFNMKKKEGWINLFRHLYSTDVSVIFDTEEEAAKNSNYGKNPRFIKTVHLEWEE